MEYLRCSHAGWYRYSGTEKIFSAAELLLGENLQLVTQEWNLSSAGDRWTLAMTTA